MTAGSGLRGGWLAVCRNRKLYNTVQHSSSELDDGLKMSSLLCLRFDPEPREVRKLVRFDCVALVLLGRVVRVPRHNLMDRF
jgi:hypothetical protein